MKKIGTYHDIGRESGDMSDTSIFNSLDYIWNAFLLDQYKAIVNAKTIDDFKVKPLVKEMRHLIFDRPTRIDLEIAQLELLNSEETLSINNFISTNQRRFYVVKF